jgi:hypothetical protein
MDIEFHFYATWLIAWRAGFSKQDAGIIGHASQFVDDNDVCLKVRDRKAPKRAIYRNYISQTMNILKPKHELLRIYPIFHFIPGDPEAETAWRRDGKMHRLNTTPNSSNANELLDAALSAHPDTRLYRIGIATHAFVDTWAHQNFVGWYDGVNSLDIDVKPAIGHAEAEHHPDWIGHKWVDARLAEPDVDNTHRFLSAAKALFAAYRSHLQPDGRKASSDWEPLKQDLLEVFGLKYTGSAKRYEPERLQAFRDKLHIGEEDAFDDRAWFDAAVDTETQGLEDSHEGIWSALTLFEDKYFWKEGVDREDTHWYRFQEAVKEHEREGIKLLSPLFRRMGINLARR